MENKIIRPLAKPRKNQPSVFIPYVSEKFTSDIKRLFKDFDLPVSVVTIPPPNLRKLLTRSRLYEATQCHAEGRRKTCKICPDNGDGACMLKGVIYRIDCECGEFYVGQTANYLWHRIDQHMTAVANPNTSSNQTNALVRHFTKSPSHTGGAVPKFNISILESGLVHGYTRVVAEAHFIQKLKPTLNGKDELEGLELLLC